MLPMIGFPFSMHSRSKAMAKKNDRIRSNVAYKRPRVNGLFVSKHEEMKLKRRAIEIYEIKRVPD